MKLWTYSYDAKAGVVSLSEVDCPNGRYPNCDANGNVVYDNTHFERKADAVAALVANAEAHVSLSGRLVIDARSRLRDAEKDAADAVVMQVVVADLERKEFPR